MSDETLAERELERQRRAFTDLCTERWKKLVAERGVRYEPCLLSNYQSGTVESGAAVGQVRQYMEQMEARIKEGSGLVLFGPKGTGKDHLVMCCARRATFLGNDVRWLNGMDLFGKMRDLIGGEGNERDFITGLTRADVLYLSDPLPPTGALTEFQSITLFRILDGRYSNRRPTWATVNVTGRKELDERLGPQNADRLVDGATAIFCNWPSYRRARE